MIESHLMIVLLLWVAIHLHINVFSNFVEAMLTFFMIQCWSEHFSPCLHVSAQFLLTIVANGGNQSQNKIQSDWYTPYTAPETETFSLLAQSKISVQAI